MNGDEEPVDDLLVLGILFMPPVFVWFLLRPRYSREIRIGAGLYAAVIVIALAGWSWRLLGF